MPLNFTESSSRFCKRNEDYDGVMGNVTTCPVGSYCLELKQLELTKDLKMCNQKCAKDHPDEDPTYYNSTYNDCLTLDLGGINYRPCTPSNFLFQSFYT